MSKAGLYSFYGREYLASLQLRRYIRCDHDRRFMVSLRSGHSAVALILTKVRTIGDRYLSQLGVISRLSESLRHLGGDQIQKLFHCYLQNLMLILFILQRLSF